MIRDAALVAVSSAAVFGALVLMSDRKRGAFLAQLGTAAAGAILFAAVVLSDRPEPSALVAAFGTALLAATASGMFYHLYLGRFTSPWPARGIFTLIFFVIAGVFGLIFLSSL